MSTGGLYVAPTLIEDSDNSARTSREEIFGPGASWSTSDGRARCLSAAPGKGHDMDARLLQALAINESSTAWERTVDITTIGARTGKQRRLEIWFHRVDGKYYLSTLPGRPSWYFNLVANPRFTFHLKHGVQADLPATAVPITDDETRQRVFQHIVADMNQPHNPARIRQPTHLEDWMAGSPLIQVVFDS
ncbi:MAG: hypothetical protein QOG05_6227 [Streptosporangiaceae bacterium]|nr:hypothetical protein [Streptosporangiaceae bacterium]